jgi:putative membrane protein
MEISPLLYTWIKVVHIVAIISWMVGLLYLPRLFIYHSESAKGSDKSETFKIMERRLLWGIMNPAMLVTLVTGYLMIHFYGLQILVETWLVIKIVCLCFLLVVHMCMVKWRKDFEADINNKSQFFFRVINEVPTVLMITIVVMVVIKPF